MMIFSVYNSLPAGLRYNLKKLFRTAGHSRSWLDGFIAQRDACGKKSLANSLSHTLHLLGLLHMDTLQGQVTLDFGAGYVPTDAVIHWLLGAERAYAIDYNAIADFRALKLAVEQSDAGSLLDLVPEIQKQQFASRLARLKKLDRFTLYSLGKLGICYQAPFDLLQRRPLQCIDLLLSTSVLEHLPPRDVRRILQALAGALSYHGRMIHEIHLEDHLDLQNDPGAFLRSSTLYDPHKEYDSRGNRLLRKEWSRYFAELDHCHSSEIEVRFMSRDKWPARGELLPEYRKLPADEIFVSHLVCLSQKHAH